MRRFRLDQYLQLALEISRRDARKLLRDKRISVNGEVTTNRGILVTEKDRVLFEAERLFYSDAPRYFVLNKPAGYVSSHRNDGHPSLFHLLKEPRKDELIIAGRLDADTTGLVLITDDGKWSHRVTHPNSQIEKKYRVELAESINQEAIALLEKGVKLRGDVLPTLPAKVKKLGETTIELMILEGRYHQVKRMCAAVGNRVTLLHRERVGCVDLTDLGEGQYRPLTEQEIEGFRA